MVNLPDRLSVPDDTEQTPAREAASLAKAVCERLKANRLERGLSIYRLSQLSGLNERAIDFIEKGERTPTIDTIARIALAMGVKVSEVINEAEKDCRP